jgi:hypothetical protein
LRWFTIGLLMFSCNVAAFAEHPAPPSKELSATLQQVADRACAQEVALSESLRNYSPLAETYIQELRPDKELGYVPSRDHYFLAQLDLRKGLREQSFMAKPSRLKRMMTPLNVRTADLKGIGVGVQPLVVDQKGFNREHYVFTFVGREFLGSVRTLVFDVAPRKHVGAGRFVGRIWVEELDYNIVRVNGTFKDAPLFSSYVHFDSWRANVNPRQWLPTYVYIEESDLASGFGHIRMKGVTTVWGYALQSNRGQQELTDIQVDASVQDHSQSAPDYSPIQRQRLWERQAEDNVIERLERAGLVAPEGEVNKVLETVVNNLLITNNLNIEPAVRARVLLTSELESFTVGHTIVISRGLIDVLPDEATLAMMLAHELGHIVLGHQLETKYAFSDRMLFPDWESFRRLQLRRDKHEEDDADSKAIAMLKLSPYADKLQSAGLFLRALSQQAPQLASLVGPHFGNRLLKGGELLRFAQLMHSAPPLKREDVTQVAALPLAARGASEFLF